MMDYREALQRILERAAPLPRSRVRLDRACGLALAEPARARRDMPRFDGSSMDGFGVRVADVAGAARTAPAKLVLSGTIRPGERPRRLLRAGEAVKIFTGAAIPPGVEAVVMKEHCEEAGGIVRVRKEARTGENIRRRGEEMARGKLAIEAGTRITPPVVGLLAALGRTSVSVHRPPRVAVIATGDEILGAGRKLEGSKIHDSNSPALTAALTDLGIAPWRVSRAKDDAALLRRELSFCLGASDVVLTVGGVSVGDRDLVKDVLETLGVEKVFWRSAVKPGRPIYFGERRKRGGSRCSALVFALPGNPVSVLVTFHQFVKPALLKLMGFEAVLPATLSAVLRGELRKEAGRLEWVRGTLRRERGAWVARPCRGQESHMLSGLAGASCLIEFPRASTRLRDGATVSVTLLSWRQ